jgi:hypothetical protein
MDDPLHSQVDGSHYRDLKIQPAEYAHANGLGYCESIALRYITRHKSKGKARDIRAAIHALQLLLKLEYGEAP